MSGIITIGQKLGIQVIAEGVESTKRQLSTKPGIALISRDGMIVPLLILPESLNFLPKQIGKKR